MDMVGAKGTHFMSGDKQRVNMGKGKEGLEEGRGIKKEGEVVGKRVLSWDTSSDKVGHPTPG